MASMIALRSSIEMANELIDYDYVKWLNIYTIYWIFYHTTNIIYLFNFYHLDLYYFILFYFILNKRLLQV